MCRQNAEKDSNAVPNFFSNAFIRSLIFSNALFCFCVRRFFCSALLTFSKNFWIFFYFFFSNLVVYFKLFTFTFNYNIGYFDDMHEYRCFKTLSANKDVVTTVLVDCISKKKIGFKNCFFNILMIIFYLNMFAIKED